ncbi:hypothetical protein BDW60DRAFT_48098 [Aspergillus nidulans var. acristatus]
MARIVLGRGLDAVEGVIMPNKYYSASPSHDLTGLPEVIHHPVAWLPTQGSSIPSVASSISSQLHDTNDPPSPRFGLTMTTIGIGITHASSLIEPPVRCRLWCRHIQARSRSRLLPFVARARTLEQQGQRPRRCRRHWRQEKLRQKTFLSC